MKSIKTLATCLLFLFSFSARALDADTIKWYDDKIAEEFKQAEVKYPDNQSLKSFKTYYYKNHPDRYATELVLSRLVKDKLAIKSPGSFKKLTFGEVCGIGASVRMYAYFSTVTSGTEGTLYKSQGYRDAQRISLTYKEYLSIVNAFEYLRSDYEKDEAQYGIDGTADRVFDTFAGTCVKEPARTDSLALLIANDAVDFSKTKVIYKEDH